MTVNQVFEAYIQYQKTHMAPATLASRGSLLKHWALPQLGERNVSDIKPADIEAIYDQMEDDGLKANTLFGAYAAMRSFFRYAQESGYIDQNPAIQTRKYNRDYHTTE